MVPGDNVMRLDWVSDRHLRISFDSQSVTDVHARVHGAHAALRTAALPGVLDVTPAYATLVIEFALDGLDEQQAERAVRRSIDAARQADGDRQVDVVSIPVCYEPPHAPDAAAVAQTHGIDVPTMIRLHTQPLYTVQFIGFSPGFAYLEGLPAQLATPRLASPRPRVPAGSVGIAGDRTGVYPSAKPGGWRLIGRTPLVMFDAARPRPSLLVAGDRVRFVAIDAAQFDALSQSPASSMPADGRQLRHPHS